TLIARNIRGLLLSIAQRLSVFFFARNPDAAVVAKRLRHQRELRLIVARLRDTGRVNLNVARVSEHRATLVGAPCSGAVGVERVGAQEVHASISTGAQKHCVSGVLLKLTSDEVSGDDAF